MFWYVNNNYVYNLDIYLITCVIIFYFHYLFFVMFSISFSCQNGLFHHRLFLCCFYQCCRRGHLVVLLKFTISFGFWCFRYVIFILIFVLIFTFIKAISIFISDTIPNSYHCSYSPCPSWQPSTKNYPYLFPSPFNCLQPLPLPPLPPSFCPHSLKLKYSLFYYYLY
jgi:hypothetical protein